jgi:hypothetical protein
MKHRPILKVERSTHSTSFCGLCNRTRAWYAEAEEFGETYRFDLPCGHSWGVQVHLTSEELAVALLMLEGA